MSNELPVILRVELAKYLDGNRPQRWTKRAGLSVLTSLGETEDRGRGLKVDPAPLGHWTISVFCSLGGIKMDSKYPTTGLKHYRPHFPETKRILPSVVKGSSFLYFDMIQNEPS